MKLLHQMKPLVSWLRVLSVGALLFVSARAAEEARRNYNLPAGDAAAVLRQFSEISGRETLYAAEVVRGVRTNAVQGEFTARDALNRLLAGTPLMVVQDEKTGAFAVSKVSDPNVQRVAPVAKSGDRPKTEANQEAPVVLEEMAVTGSRIRGLLGEAVVQPVLTMTARDIERTGATNLGEIFRYVPQISTYTEGQFQQSPFAFGASTGSEVSGRITATLRGSPAGGTLLLINGRRAPRNGQQQGQDGYDLGGIPLNAVERVEVLLDGASAVYGADAVGGVINVILKRNYRSTDVRLSYENTLETDVNVKSVSLNHGFSSGKLSGMVSVAYQESGNLMWADRDYLQTFDRRAFGGSNNNNAQIPSANGTINVPAGNAAGVPAGTLLTIPAGSNGTNKTPAEFVAAGSPPAPAGTNTAQWAAYNSAYERLSALGSLEYQFRPGLTAFLDLRVSDNETLATAGPPAASSLSIPATAPGNVFGVPVTMRRYLLDLPVGRGKSSIGTKSGVLGLRGKLPRDWQFEGSVGYSFSRPEYLAPGFSISSTNFAAALASSDPAKRPNLFYDAVNGTNPNAPGLIESLLDISRNLEESAAWVYEVKADGPVCTLWAGDVRAAVGGEFREEYVKFPLVTPDDLYSARPGNREVTGLFAEVRLPLLSQKQGIPLVHSLEVSAAVRRDGYHEFDDAVTPRYSVGYRPFAWLLGRASYGEGYKIPTLSQTGAPARISNTYFSVSNPPIDIYRGNTPVTLLIMPGIFGGNPNLQPEETESTTAGVVLEIPHRWFKGLSFSYDFYDHEYLNRISSLNFAERLAIFPELFVRGPNLPGDPAGWSGPIVSYDNRPVNIAINRITGWDAGMKYLRSTPWGEFLLNGNVSKTYRNQSRPRPGAPPANAVFAVPEYLPLRTSGSLFWSRKGLETGVLFSYRDKFKRQVNERLTPSSIRWDWRGSYDFKQARWARPDAEHWWQRVFADTQLSLTVYNVLDEPPPFNYVGLPDSSVVDALGTRYVISFNKSFGRR